MDSEPASPLSNFFRPKDWEFFGAFLAGDSAETSSKTDEVQFPQNASNVQDSRTTTSDTSPNPMSSHMDVSGQEDPDVGKKKYFTHEEIIKLMQGIEESISQYRCWKQIKEIYFANSDRQPNQLKQKWKNIRKEEDDLNNDPELRELYKRAKKAYSAKRATKKVPRH